MRSKPVLVLWLLVGLGALAFDMSRRIGWRPPAPRHASNAALSLPQNEPRRVVGVNKTVPAPGEMVEYTITGLGALEGDLGSWAVGINNRGDVAYDSFNDHSSATNSNRTHALLWRNGGATCLPAPDVDTMPDPRAPGGQGRYQPESTAGAIDDAGDVIGRVKVATDDRRPARWRSGVCYAPQLAIWRAPMLPRGPVRKEVISWNGAFADVNARGTIVGRFEQDACVWKGIQSSPVRLGSVWKPMGRYLDEYHATAVNDRDQVVGIGSHLKAERTEGFRHACLWRPGSAPRDLGTLGGVHSWARDINDREQIVGTADTKRGTTHAFLWERGRMRDIGSLPGHPNSAAHGVNETGVIVGASHTGPVTGNIYGFWPKGGASRATIWRGGKVADLNERIPRGSRWILHHAAAINDRGQIVGTGEFRGQIRAFLLDPVALSDAGAVTRR